MTPEFSPCFETIENPDDPMVQQYRDKFYKIINMCFDNPVQADRLAYDYIEGVGNLKIARIERYMDGGRERIKIVRLLKNHSK